MNANSGVYSYGGISYLTTYSNPMQTIPTTASKYAFAVIFINQTMLKQPCRIDMYPEGDYAYESLFMGSGIVEAPCMKMYREGSSIGVYALAHLFHGCKDLESVPHMLHIGHAASNTFDYMFKDCKKLKFSANNYSTYTKFIGVINYNASYNTYAGNGTFNGTGGEYTWDLLVDSGIVNYYTANRVIKWW